MTFTDQYNSDTIRPVTYSYQAIALSEDTTLSWPIEADSEFYILASWLDVTPDAAGLTISFPDATKGSRGFATYITNLGAETYTVDDSDGNTIQTIEAGQTWVIWLKNNETAAGSWGTGQFGSTTSEASANSLAGLGIKAIGLTLNQSHPVWEVNADYFIDPAQDRARLINWNGGSGSVNFPSANSLGDDFFTLITNQGDGIVTIYPDAGEEIDGASSKILGQQESCFVICDGVNLFTVGYGRSITFSDTYLNLNVAGSSNITLTSTQFSSNIIRLFGVLTGNIDVIVPAAVHQFIVTNDTTGSFTITVKVSGMTGVVVEQSQSMLLYNDGTDVYAGNTVNTVSTGFFANGSATSPSISFTSDTDTGIFRFGANQLGLTANGSASHIFNGVSGGVNAATTTPATSGNPVVIGTYSGTDTNVGLTVTPQGTGAITLTNATTISGAATLSSTLALTGNFAINTNKFTVAASSGNTVVAGTLNVTGQITGNLTGNVTGNASTATLAATATALATSRNFSIAGSTGLTASAVGFDGTAAVALSLAGTLDVDNGGTGVTSLTAHGVVIGNGTSAVAVTSAGTAGQVLTSNGASSDPTFQTFVASVPVGGGFEWYSNTLPTPVSTEEYVFQYGQAISRTTYSVLFAIIGTTFGNGDGSTTFNLPDQRGRAGVGRDDMGGVAANRITNAASGITGTTLGAAGGSQTHTLVTGEIPAHSHPLNVKNGLSGSTGDGPLGSLASGSSSSTWGGSPPDTTYTTTIANAGGGGAHNNVQPTIIINKVMRIK